MEPNFLTLSEILEIHQDQITRYGGARGIRDAGLLKSAIAQPQAHFGGNFLHKEVHSMAAAYLFHLVSNHPFVDGNKRVGAVASIVFLELNNIEFTATEESFEKMILSVAAGKMTKEEITTYLLSNSHQIEDPQ